MTLSSRRRLLPALVCAFALLGAAPAPAPDDAAVAPDFGFTDMQGNPHTLAEMRGKVVLLEFWASWCIPCRKGFPFLDTLAKQYRADGFEVVAVSLETDDDAVSAFVAAFPSTFLVGRDPSGRGGELYAVAAMPTSVLLARDGSELARFEGGSDSVHERMEEAIEAVMRGKPIPGASESRQRKGPRGNLRAWERGYLADPIMNLDGDMLTRSMRDHIHSSKEAAAGNGGVSGGGCGCN